MFLALGSRLSCAAFCRHGSLVASCQHYLWTNMNFSASSNLDRHLLSLHNKAQNDHYPPLACTLHAWDDKTSKAQPVPQLPPPPLAAVTAAHAVLGTLGTRAVWLAHGQQPRGTDKPGCTSPFPHCSEPVPNPDAVLPPTTLGQCQQQSLLSPVHLIYTQDRHFLS